MKNKTTKCSVHVTIYVLNDDCEPEPLSTTHEVLELPSLSIVHPPVKSTNRKDR